MKVKIISKKVLTLFLFFLVFGVSAYAQEEKKEPAILLSGPKNITGLDFLPSNNFPAKYGIYDFEEKLVAVYYVGDETSLSMETIPFDCGPYTLMEVFGMKRRIFRYRDSGGWEVFISFDQEIRDPCVFIEVFLRRFRYFLGIVKDESGISFPAVLEYR